MKSIGFRIILNDLFCKDLGVRKSLSRVYYGQGLIVFYPYDVSSENNLIFTRPGNSPMGHKVM
jgi:hypothetical protein